MPWLMKAEPDSRVVKGKDVKFSVDDFEAIGISPWDGVRNHEAKKIMKEKMRLGDKVLFYHSNCKVPGVFAIAEVAKEGYPDYTSWDPNHPYFDAKTDENSPTWYMVSVKFNYRLLYPPTLQLIKYLSTLTELPKELEYIGVDGLKAISCMQLVNRGRLSVQFVDQDAYDAIILLGTKGGWEDLLPSISKSKAKSTATAKAKVSEEVIDKVVTDAKPTKSKNRRDIEHDDSVTENKEKTPSKKTKTKTNMVKDEPKSELKLPTRRSTRVKG